MKTKIMVRVENENAPSVWLEQDVPQLFIRAFESVDWSDTPSVMTGMNSVNPCSQEAKIITKIREDAAADIAKHLTDMIMKHFHSIDTDDGYKR